MAAARVVFLDQPLTPETTTIGILGGGQLGRMLTFAAKEMGYRVHIYTPEEDSPASQVADKTTVGAFEDIEKIQAFGAQVDVITLEFENIPVQALDALESQAPVRPSRRVLEITQHRLREKSTLAQWGFPVTPFIPVQTFGAFEHGVQQLGGVCVLKTTGFGYDGKGQYKVAFDSDLKSIWEAFLQGQHRDAQNAEGILEQFVPFEREISVIGHRGLDGQVSLYLPFENEHRNHVLNITVAPAPIHRLIKIQAHDITQQLLEKLDVVGTLCIEFFLTKNQELLINELAPRVHNSGHITQACAYTSQFEQHIRAICGLVLGNTGFRSAGAMINLLGNVWESGPPPWNEILTLDPTLKLHLYGKQEARPGRKMGHINLLAPTPEQAHRAAEATQFAITRLCDQSHALPSHQPSP